MLQFVSVSASSIFAPTWMKIGAYVEYETTADISFVNKTGTHINDQIVFRWECVELDGDMAKITVSVDGGDNITEIHSSETISVNTVSRNVYFLNGTLIGTTRLWFPANPTQNQEIIVWDFPPEKVVGTADIGTSNNPIRTLTPQGLQKMFFVWGQGIIRGEDCSITGEACDFDTGLLLIGFLLHEPLLRSLGIRDFMTPVVLADTNIDLGPREIIYDIQAIIPYVLIIVAFVLTVVMVYRQRRKKRKHSRITQKH
jgi:hypothetical protein